MTQADYDIYRMFENPEAEIEELEGDDRPVRCKRCGRQDLYWSNHVDGMRLENANGTLHECQQNDASGFENVA